MNIVLAYLGVVAIWATTPLAIKWSGETDWFFGVAARTALGALLILPVAWWLVWRRQTAARFSLDWPAVRVYLAASLPILGAMTFMYWAAQYLPSGWIAILFALNPVMTGILAHFCLPNSRLSVRKILGVLISLTGLLIIFVPNMSAQQTEMQLLAIGAALISVFFHSYGSVLVKRVNDSVSPVHVVVGALWVSVLGHLMLSPTALLSWPALTSREAAAIVYAASIGSVVGFLLYFYLLKNIDAVKVSLIPVITPVFGLLLGHFLNEEPLNAAIWSGAGLVLFGLVLFEWRLQTLWGGKRR
ncbi:DMT family transporter [Thiomicrorhabdus sp. zzn3]|uniref:DMT family transporter n=1 Tax=Thiomicrorhabdus sp. zzn3 TaxID=3039775 RepID=UPI002436914E|nr:DMT family transporter [Thiomicrorhabdus sp. zzn3]MDG6778028.1 DMT family transporter [Thiomicrorhabdus sp. zzn3]